MTRSVKMVPSMIKEFVSIASRCDFDIDIASSNRYFVDAKSILGVLGLDFNRTLTLKYDGFNADLENFLKANSAAC